MRKETAVKDRVIVSVIVPAHNEEKYVVRCIHSIREAEKEFGGGVEIIVICNRCTDRTAELAEKNGVDYNLPILLGYAGTSDELLQNYIHDSRKLWEGHVENLEYAQICSVVGTHTGPGAVAAAFFRTNQDAEAE